MKATWRLGLLFYLLSYSTSPTLGEQQQQDEDEEFDEMDFYFYSGEPDASTIIGEYVAPHEDWNETCPDFIYQPQQVTGIRIVEFYAHWCPHCQHFRNNYIQFAKQTKQLIQHYAPHIKINMFAVSCVPWKPVCVDMGVHAYPAIFLFPDGSVNGTRLNHFDIHPFMMLSLLGIEVDDLSIDAGILEDEGSANSLRIGSNNNNNNMAEEKHNFFLPRTKHDIYNDAYLSFDFAMRNAIFIDQKVLKNETADVFAEWIEQLQAAVPPTWKLKNLLTEIKENMNSIRNSEAVLIDILDRHPPKSKTWSQSCTRGDKFAGYTCGLWELFHIMTVGLVEWNVFANEDDWYYFRPSHSAKVLRNYIDHFFGCEVCRVNFLHAFDECEYDRCNRLIHDIGDVNDWKELPLWLYETHNGVNQRLLRERTDRDENRLPTKMEDINVQWPPKHECPMCWHADGRWDEDNVYNYLRLTYWPEDEMNAEIRELLAASQVLDDDNVDDDSARNWNWLLLALFCSAIILSGTVWYLKRRRLRRTGRHKKVDA